MALKKEKLEIKFREEYEKLNKKQKLAVDTIHGPVMVIAGPGTGKTQILATRIGKILLETDAFPENILCLTYTDAGVVAMRKRLIRLIGPDAYKVSICTFHAFCNEVIQENLFLFEKTALDPVSDLEKVEIFKELIDSFPKDHPLKRYRGDVYFEIRNLESLFSNMKREGWTADFLNTKIDEYINDIPNRDEFVYKRKYKEYNAGDLKKDKIEAELEKMNRLKAAVGEFDRYQKIMNARKRYDFDDMINWVIKAFEENSNLLADYQEQFQFILVDEYQDNSGTQNRIVELLISFWDQPNVFVVGDDDQSIYRFQGANVENMMDFAHHYKNDLVTVVLTNNYRSTQPILDVSKTLISNNDERLVKKIPGLSKDLVSSHDLVSKLKNLPEIRQYENQRMEMIDITQRVETLLSEGVAAHDIGIIYKENRYGEELTDYFRLRNLPFYRKKGLNILQLPLARKLVLILKYLDAEHDIPYSGDEMLFEILHFDWFAIPSIEIAKLTAEASEIRYSDKQSSLRKLLADKSAAPGKDLFTSNLFEGMKRASVILESLLAAVPNFTLQHLFEKLVRETGLLGHIMKSPDKHFQLQVLTGLFDFIKEETRRNPDLGLKELIVLISLMEKEDISLPLTQVAGNDKGVNLMTAHGAKGLEFEYVFFCGCNSGFWEKKRKPGGGYKLPDTIFNTLSQQSEEEELRRLFYVALTRAKIGLSVSYSQYKMDGRDLEPSMFIEEIQEVHNLAVEKIVIPEEKISEFSVLHFMDAAAPEIEKLEREFVERKLEKFVMNVTALNNYLKCPLEFYFRNLIRIPSPKNEATEFGSAVHYALERLFRKMQEGGKEEFPSIEEFIADFEWYMHRHRESFTPEQFSRRMEYGRDVLSDYYVANLPGFNKIVAIERNIKNVMVQHVPIKGKLDKLEFDGKSVNVVDYKTGDPDKAFPKLKGPSEKDPVGGDYWRQAVFYKILVDHYEQKDWRVVSSEFDFIEPDKNKKYQKKKLLIEQQDIETVTRQIVDVWDKIQQFDFYTGCGMKDCHWCGFVKTNNMAVALHALEQEEEPEY